MANCAPQPQLFGREAVMSEDKIISADDAILQKRAKLLAELCDITTAADKITALREENARLREKVSRVRLYATAPLKLEAMTAERDSLREENARLRETLKPFVAENIQAFEHAPDSDKCFVRCVVTFGDMRAAAAAIREGEKDD